MTTVHWIKNIHEEKEIIKNNQMGILDSKHKIMKMQYSLDGPDSRFELAEKESVNFQFYPYRLLQSEEQNEKRIKTKMNRVSEK